MTRKEFAVFADRVKVAYPKDNLLSSKDAMDWWYDLLGDLPFPAAMSALKQHAVSNKFPPTVAEIRQAATETLTTVAMDVDEAWGIVIRAIRTYGYMGEAEALDSFPEPCKSVVRNIGWQNLCQSENIMAERAFFRDNYKVKMERQKKENALPLSVRSEKAALLEQKISQAVCALTMKEPPNG
mgnify:CR=1 FL=1